MAQELQDFLGLNPTTAQDLQNKDMIDDSEDTIAKCICGAELTLTEAQQCYDECKSIECDLCETEVSGASKVYHCIEKSDKHKEGYDICVPCASSQPSGHFCDNIFATLHQQANGSNLILSPLSISIAMTLCMCGSAEQTLKEMLNVLYPNAINKKPSFQNAKRFTKQVLKTCVYFNKEYGCSKGSRKPFVKMANKIWINSNFKVLDTYIKAIGKKNVDNFDTSNPSNAATIVNQWCAENTNNMIKEVVDASIMSGVELLIANAIYFKGKFEHKFPKNNTKKNVSFYQNKSRSETISKDIRMMCQFQAQWFKKGYKSKNGDGGKYDIVRLAYKNSDLSLILAINNYSTRQKKLLTQQDIASVKWKYKTLHLYVPKFKYEFKMVLNDVLQRMGIRQAFGDNADFSGMTGDKSLQIGKVIHKAVIEVDEEGTEAAAVTVVTMKRKGRSMHTPKEPPTIRFDHPFSFYIYHGEKDVVLFCGTYGGNKK
eukprot:97603_1